MVVTGEMSEATRTIEEGGAVAVVREGRGKEGYEYSEDRFGGNVQTEEEEEVVVVVVVVVEVVGNPRSEPGFANCDGRLLVVCD